MNDDSDSYAPFSREFWKLFGTVIGLCLLPTVIAAPILVIFF